MEVVIAEQKRLEVFKTALTTLQEAPLPLEEVLLLLALRKEVLLLLAPQKEVLLLLAFKKEVLLLALSAMGQLEWGPTPAMCMASTRPSVRKAVAPTPR